MCVDVCQLVGGKVHGLAIGANRYFIIVHCRAPFSNCPVTVQFINEGNGYTCLPFVVIGCDITSALVIVFLYRV